MKVKFILLATVILLTSLLNAAPPLTVISPATGQTWKYGQTYTISWTRPSNSSANVRIYLKKPGGQSILKTITSSAPNSGTYHWRSDYYDGEYVIVVSTIPDSNSPTSSQGISKVVKLTGLYPDLHINWVKVTPKKKNVRTKIKFTASIYNAGLSTAKATTAKLEIKGPKKKTIYIPFGELKGHMTNTLTYDYTLPQYGIYRNTLTLDAKKDLHSNNPQISHETNLSNNVKYITYGVNPLPDLVVITKQYQHVKVPKKSTIVVKVKNIGDTPSPKSKLRFWIEKKGVKIYTIPSLKPGKIFVVKRKEYWGTSGKRKFSAHIDYNNIVKEKKDNNNKLSGSIQKGGKYGVQNKEVSSDNVSNN
ncbi:MAG: hypothetical protein GY756_22510 [bacterium]|nr:hypothetical protein [bacterium]